MTKSRSIYSHTFYTKLPIDTRKEEITDIKTEAAAFRRTQRQSSINITMQCDDLASAGGRRLEWQSAALRLAEGGMPLSEESQGTNC